MTTMIKRDAVIRLMDNNGFDCEVKDNEHHLFMKAMMVSAWISYAHGLLKTHWLNIH